MSGRSKCNGCGEMVSMMYGGLCFTCAIEEQGWSTKKEMRSSTQKAVEHIRLSMKAFEYNLHAEFVDALEAFLNSWDENVQV